MAVQTEITGRFTSLTKQRRAVLPNPAALESVDEGHAHPYVELIPTAKNRSNSQETINLSKSYQEACEPEMDRHDDHRRPESAVL